MSSARSSSAYYHLPPSKAPAFTPYISYGLQEDDFYSGANYQNHLIFIWFDPDAGFWVFPKGFTDTHLQGLGWHRAKWVEVQIPIEEIMALY